MRDWYERRRSHGSIPRSAAARAARLAALPAGYAGRSAVQAGKRLLGQSADVLTEEFERRTAEHLFSVLGGLKGGAMKIGQLLSVFEAAFPPHVVEPYRAALTRLQAAAPPLPTAAVRRVLEDGLGADWRKQLPEFDEVPAAAASIGQVHRATWHDGRTVAVKIQYPHAREALLGDYARFGRVIRMFSVLAPGLEVGPMVDELRLRVSEELDYRAEAAAQQEFADAFRGDELIHVPDVLAGTDRVLVTAWTDGRPLAEVIAAGTQEERDAAGLRYARFLLSGPARAGMLHADPHPGNYRILADGRLGVLDFGAVQHLPDGFPPLLGALQRHAHARDYTAAAALLRAEGFLRPGPPVDPAAIEDFLAPIAAPSAEPTFHFHRGWLREEVARSASPRSKGLVRQLNLPPSYVLVNRVVMAGSAVLCQLDCTVPFRAEAARWLPGFTLPA
ncbi:AarF/ABC1/UbiB kinase family protein [Streptomyces sp. NPDC046876]|uniref:ABC1 kinase family protein n=1 Tax=Streptomyces sp. NPDC046876 TaxID=3155616 RepID=UPI0033D899F3